MKINNVEYVGREIVYDLTMPTNHNFILECGTVAHNCSHSKSYGLVTHNGAWLKINYPLEFWMGLLTAYADKREEIKDLMEECFDLVLPVDAVKSHANDWLIEDGKLRPPLITVKGMGDGAAKNLKLFLESELSNFTKRPPKIKKSKKKSDAVLTDLAFGE